MRDAVAPRLHLFVCANRREDSPLGPGCAARGEVIYDALKQEVASRGDFSRVWITKTHCLGICPRHGATIARYPALPERSAIMTEVELSDLHVLMQAPAPVPGGAGAVLGELARELDAIEELQRKKVLDLARRLKPGLTLEDVQNPHDFPELDDPDWHYADGVLTGIASVKTALQALERDKRDD